MDVDALRTINFHTHESLKLFYGNAAGDPVDYTLPLIWDKIGASTGFVERIAAIECFNQSSIWRKRGISRVPIVYEVTIKQTPGKVSILSDGSIVVEVGGIEMGQGLWTKVQQTAAYALSAVRCDGTQEMVERVRVVQSDTLSMAQGGITSGSTTSEVSCVAVQQCCNVLVERLSPFLNELQAKIGPVTWKDLIIQVQSLDAFLVFRFIIRQWTLTVLLIFSTGRLMIGL